MSRRYRPVPFWSPLGRPSGNSLFSGSLFSSFLARVRLWLTEGPGPLTSGTSSVVRSLLLVHELTRSTYSLTRQGLAQTVEVSRSVLVLRAPRPQCESRETVRPNSGKVRDVLVSVSRPESRVQSAPSLSPSLLRSLRGCRRESTCTAVPWVWSACGSRLDVPRRALHLGPSSAARRSEPTLLVLLASAGRLGEVGRSGWGPRVEREAQPEQSLSSVVCGRASPLVLVEARFGR